MKNLAAIRKIDEVNSSVDTVFDVLRVGGWFCLAPKNSYKVGDIGVFFQVGSFLPARDTRFDFLNKFFFKYENSLGFHVKHIKFKNFNIQGLFIGLNKFPELSSFSIGYDVTNHLKIRHYDVDDFVFYKGFVSDKLPDFIDKYETEHLQNLSGFLEREIFSRTFEKFYEIKGIKLFIYFKDNNVGICSENLEFLDKDNNTFWKTITRQDIPNSLNRISHEVVLSGYFAGPGILGNPINLSSTEFLVYDIYDIKSKRSFYIHERDIFLNCMRDLGSKIECLEHGGFHTFTKGASISDLVLEFNKQLENHPENNSILFKRIDGEFSFKVISTNSNCKF